MFKLPQSHSDMQAHKKLTSLKVQVCINFHSDAEAWLQRHTAHFPAAATHKVSEDPGKQQASTRMPPAAAWTHTKNCNSLKNNVTDALDAHTLKLYLS